VLGRQAEVPPVQAPSLPLTEAFGTLVYLWRLDRRLTSGKLAEIADIDLDEIENIERDESYRPEARTVCAIASIMKVPELPLLQLTGNVVTPDTDFAEHSMAFAANAKRWNEISKEQKRLLHDYLKYITQRAKHGCLPTLNNLYLRDKNAQQIDRAIERVLSDLGHPDPPIKLVEVRRLLRIDLAYYQSSKEGVLKDVVHGMKMIISPNKGPDRSHAKQSPNQPHRTPHFLRLHTSRQLRARDGDQRNGRRRPRRCNTSSLPGALA